MKRARLTKLDEAILLHDKDAFVRWARHRALTALGCLRGILSDDARAYLTGPESVALRERTELHVEQWREFLDYANAVEAGTKNPPWEETP